MKYVAARGGDRAKGRPKSGWFTRCDTDVAGVRVGHGTLIRGIPSAPAVTVVLPPDDNAFRDKVQGAV